MVDSTLLYAAIEASDLSSVERLLAAEPGAVGGRDQAGMTPLMRAVICRRRCAPVVRALLDRGALVNAQSPGGFSALHLAVDVDDPSADNAAEIIASLVARGADLELRQRYGWTPLLCAVVRGRTREARFLLDLGADANASFPSDTVPAYCAGRTALMAALACNAGCGMVAALLEAGADPLQRDGGGGDFFAYAEALRRDAWDGRAELVDRSVAVVRRWAATSGAAVQTCEEGR